MKPERVDGVCSRECGLCSRSKGGQRRFERGYDTTHLPAHVQRKLTDYRKPNTTHAIAEAAMTILSIPFVAACVVVYIMVIHAASIDPWLVWAGGLSAYSVSLVAIARQQRGLEILVHDASHRTWHLSRKTNDRLADLMVASPVLSSIASYWNSHRSHHGRFGSHSDPCLARFERMGLGRIDISTRLKLCAAVLRWLVPYSIEYYKEIGSASGFTVTRFVLWHLCVYVAPTATGLTVIGHVDVSWAIVQSLTAWVLFWAVPWITVLPVIRSIAESEEHDYDRADTEFEATFSNLGWAHRLIFHPKKDGFHVVHHMFPGIPERVHDKVHALLMETDEKYRRSAIRKNVLGTAK